MTVKIISVFADEAYDEHEIFYEVISSNKLDEYQNLVTSGGYALDFSKICSVTPITSSSRSPVSPLSEPHP